MLRHSRHNTFHDKKESRVRDSLPAAGRFCDIQPYRRSAIPRSFFIV